jgi:hypothetical protein
LQLFSSLHELNILILFDLLLLVPLILIKLICVLFLELLRDRLSVELAFLDDLKINLPLLDFLFLILLEVILFSSIPSEHVLQGVFIISA